jgi:hypothetical protein
VTADELDAAADSVAQVLRILPQPVFDDPAALAITDARHRLARLQTALRDAARWGWISQAVERPPAVTAPPAILRQRMQVIEGGRAS